MSQFKAIYVSRNLCAEDFVDLPEHLEDAIQNLPDEIPVDENGFHQGTFKLKLEWSPDE